MGEIQPFDHDKKLIRPLLSISREQIESHASQLDLMHISDESNGDDRYDRNFLRLDIIPKLKAGFVISGMHINEKFGTLVNLTYYINPQIKAVVDFRSGHQRLPQNLKEHINIFEDTKS